jgi:hypothetical protein
MKTGNYAATGQSEKARAAINVFLNRKPACSLWNYGHPRLYKRKEETDQYLELLRRARMLE